jgi:endonuclease YncB( thermonuclease family)
MSIKNREKYHKPPSIINDDYDRALRRLSRQFVERSAVNAGLASAISGAVDNFPVAVGLSAVIGFSQGMSIDIFQKYQSRLRRQQRNALEVANAENDIEASRHLAKQLRRRRSH